MFKKRISKSQYMMGLQCLKRIWLYNYRKDLIPPIPQGQQMRFNEGHLVGDLARNYYKGGKLIEADYKQLRQAIEETAHLVKAGTKIIYEGCFVFDDVLIRADILKKNRDKSWDLIEVKSTTSVKEIHAYDTAIQKYVLEELGFKIKNVKMMYINNKFVKNGEIKPKDFFTVKTINTETNAHLQEVKKNLRKFKKILSNEKEPEIAIGPHCANPYVCEFCDHCRKHVPDYSIYDFPHLAWQKKEELKEMGIIKIKDIPDDFPLRPWQELVLKAEKTNKSIIDNEAIGHFIKKLKYPLYFIDFETIMPSLPFYDGLRPYQQLTFQISLHIQNTIGGKVEHFEYLGDAKNDPREELIKFMLKYIKAKGSLVAYNMSFEKTRIKEIAANFPKYAKAMLKLNDRMLDIMKPFQKRNYIHPKFRGSYSLKKVLPALVSSMSYADLDIGDGGDAQIAYLNMVSGKLSDKEIKKIRKDLKIYCGQDTLAMVKILKCLYKAA
ncbi:MAG: DUF2779 domain-containing protein [Elusimicrobiales bacterium]|nr:DUF2779 domain-containing protein [Elusimicrobiales bacterium]